MEHMIANNQSLLNPIEYQPMLNDYNALFIGLYYSNAIANALHRLLINSRLPSIHLKIYRGKAREYPHKRKEKKDKTLVKVDSEIFGYDRLYPKKRLGIL